MLLTLTVSCLRPLLHPSEKGKKPMLSLLDVPRYTRESLGLAGINLTTDLLTGADRPLLEAMRDRGDKASCACLLLIEPEPQDFGSLGEGAAAKAGERMLRVLEAAHILGCSAVSMPLVAGVDEDSTLRVVTRLKPVAARAERLDINLLLSPREGLTAEPDRVTDLIKRVGGFRLGTFPDFAMAHASGDAEGYLRRLTPYASAVSATTTGFGKPKGAKKGKDSDEIVHTAYDLRPMVDAIISVGFDRPLAVDYRGPGDVLEGINQSRNLLQAALSDEDPALEDILEEMEAEFGEAEDSAEE
ncbi:MAG: sugar phosphate isomerase/epimerase family protein [Phycisphaerales bacterium]